MSLNFSVDVVNWVGNAVQHLVGLNRLSTTVGHISVDQNIGWRWLLFCN